MHVVVWPVGSCWKAQQAKRLRVARVDDVDAGDVRRAVRARVAGLLFVVPPYARGSRERISSLRSAVDVHVLVLPERRRRGRGVGRAEVHVRIALELEPLRRQLVEQFGFVGFSSEYAFTPKRPVTNITSSCLCRPLPPYSRKLIAVAFFASEIVCRCSTFFDASRRPAPPTRATRRARRGHHTYLSRMPSRIRGLVGGGQYSPGFHAALRVPFSAHPKVCFRQN